MALSASVLSAAIRTRMLADPDIGAIDGTGLTAMCDAIANSVVEHIVSAAIVSGNIVGAGGPPPGGPVTGTFAGTVT